MSVWRIYHKDGTIVKDTNGNKIDIRSLEYLDSWMGECYLTVTFKHETPIIFAMGDYIIYRNEKFVLNYEPGKDKKAKINAYGEGFVYNSVKFNSLQNELSDAEFLDVVLNDNELHYTTLPKFQFYVETLDDLLDRIQANLNEQIGAGEWKIFSRNKDRSKQRGCTADEWNAAYGEGTDDNVIDSMSVTADSMTCWDALALVNSKWNVNFIVRGRNVYVGTAGVTIGHMFEYGRGNGLYEIEQNADSEQKVITRLRAYGSEKNLPSHYYADISDNLPNNMAINRLMLPGFPSMSLNDYYNSLSKEDKVYVNPKGEKYIFSTDKYRPYVDSANISKIGLHSSSQFFDTDDKTNGIIEIYPTLEEMVIGGVRVDEINEGVAPADNGRFEDGQNVANVDIYLSPNIDFDITGLKQSDFSISMKDGMCGGRTFTVAATNKIGNRWRLTIERVKDSALDLWFPYQDYPIKAGDHFVLTGITLPDSYVKAASLKLLKYTLALLDKNDYTRYVYQPKVDELFMARQHDAAMADETGAIKSLHDTLKAGDLMDFRDDDLNIKGTITIDQLNIKEQDGKIPTYEITLREDKEVGTIQKIQQQITSLESGNGGSGGGGGITLAQVKGQVASEGSKHFISKLFDDTVKGTITFERVQLFLKGLFFGQGYGFSERGQGIIKELVSDGFNSASQQGFGIKPDDNGRYSLSITDLIVWGKAVFNELEIRKISYAGGNVYLSGAGSKLMKVVPVVYNSETGEYTLSTDEECDGWKCYILADDGTMATQNLWIVGDQARCQTFNIKHGAYDNASNREYWRCVVAVSSDSEFIVDNNGVNLYGDKKFDWIILSKTNCQIGRNDIPVEGDAIVLDGHQPQTGETSYESRTNVLMLESSGSDTPRIVGYKGIVDFTHKEKDVFVISPSNVTISSSVFKFKAASGQDITIINDRGAYDKDAGYYYYDRVSYDNAYWTFIYNGDNQPVKGVTPTEKAVNGIVYWRKDLSGGIKGDDAVSYSVQFSESTATISGVTTKILNVAFVKSVGLQISSGGLRDIGFGGTCAVYVDGVKSEGMTNQLMLGYTYLDIYNAFANEIKGKKSLSVELRDADSRVVASNIFFFAEKGDKGDKGDKGEQGVKGDKGENGANGTDGEDAISILVEGAPLTFDTNENGTIPVGISKAAKVKVMKGNRNVTNDCTSVSSRDDLCSNCKCGVTKKDEYIEVSILSDNITKNDVIDNGVNKGKVSATSGFAVAQATYNGVTYFAQVPFSVNVAKFTGVVAFNNQQYEAKFTEISNRFDDTPTNKDLKESESRMMQTAREISLSVSEKSVGRRNLLPGSAFSRQEGFGLNLDANTKGYGILMNDGVDGMNCIKVASYYDGTRYQYCGAFWCDSWTGKNVRIKRGTKYTFSCWVKVDTPDANVYLEILYEKAESGMDRDDTPTGEEGSDYFFSIKEANKWQLVKWSFTTDNTHDWVEANVYTCSSIKGKTFVAWFCKPMLEEGDYNGWTLSQEDYDYVGGNMLDNTLLLDKSGTLYEVNGTLTPAGFGESTSIYKSFVYKLKGTVDNFSQLPSSGNVYDDTYYVRNDGTCYAYNGSKFVNVGNDYFYNVLEWRKRKTGTFTPFGLEANKDYVLSFMARGTGKLTAYFYNPDTDVFIEDSLGGTDISVNGRADFQLTSEWKRYWVHWRPSDNEHKYVLLRLNRSIQSDNGDAPKTDCHIAQPKLEVGAKMTEYTERKSDLVDKASLKKAGIEVKSDEVLLYGDRIRVDNNGQTAAMFIGGKLNADFIDADKIEVKHLWAKSEDGTTKVGYFGNYEIDACKVNDTYAPLFVGADTADKALFYVSKDGYMNAKAGKIGSFLISPTGYANSIIAGTWKDATNIDINKFGTRLELSDTKLEFLYGSGSAIGGDVVYSSTNAQIAIDPSKARHGFTSCGLDIRVDVFAAAACGIHLDVSGFLGDPAIYIKNGTVWGFRPHIVSVGSDYHLRDDDTIVMCTNWNNDITLTLPDDPQHGQYYVVIHRGRNIIFKSNADKIMTKNNPSGVSSFGDSTFYQINWIFYDGEQWILIYKT